MYMTLRDTPHAALHEIVIVDSLPESSGSSNSWLQTFIFLRRVPIT